MKILFISLGCDKNLADSEEMLGLLTAGGHEITDDETQADAIVINTCCFIKDAKEESVETILEMAEYKKTGSCHALIVTGCMAQRYQKEIIEEVPEVDAVLGTTSYGDIVKALEEEGLDTIFGYPGGTVTDLFDELYKTDSINLILPRHEQGLIHEAEGYAKSTGRVGVCLVTSGPGATNIITGLADAHYDSIPLPDRCRLD